MESIDSLPYIDLDITPAEREKAERLIQRELSGTRTNGLHPSVRPLADSKYSQLFQGEIDRQTVGATMEKKIDMTRYEAPEDPEQSADVDAWKKTLRNAYTSSAYLTGRRANLQLLEEYGKNAWLIGNAELEGLLKSLEGQLETAQAETTEVNKARKLAQEGSRGELEALNDTWRRGIGKIIEVQVATEQLRQELSERRRSALNGQ